MAESAPHRFDLTNSKAIKIYLFRNGDKFHKGEEMTLNPKNVKTLEQVMDKANKDVKLVTGAIRKIYLPDLKTTIKNIEEFVDGGQYLCCSGEKPAEASKLPPPFSGK